MLLGNVTESHSLHAYQRINPTNQTESKFTVTNVGLAEVCTDELLKLDICG